MTAIANKIASFAKQLVIEHVTDPKVVPFVPSINLAIDAGVSAADIVVQTQGLPALAAHLPKVSGYIEVALPIVQGLLTVAQTPAADATLAGKV